MSSVQKLNIGCCVVNIAHCVSIVFTCHHTTNMASQKSVTRIIESDGSDTLSSETDSDFVFSSDVDVDIDASADSDSDSDSNSDSDADTCSGSRIVYRGHIGHVNMSTTHIVEPDGSTTVIENCHGPGVIFGGTIGHADMSSVHMSRKDKAILDEAAAERNKTAFKRYNEMYEEVQDELEEIRTALNAKQSEYTANPTTKLEAECATLRQKEKNMLDFANMLARQCNMYKS